VSENLHFEIAFDGTPVTRVTAKPQFSADGLTLYAWSAWRVTPEGDRDAYSGMLLHPDDDPVEELASKILTSYLGRDYEAKGGRVTREEFTSLVARVELLDQSFKRIRDMGLTLAKRWREMQADGQSE